MKKVWTVGNCVALDKSAVSDEVGQELSRRRSTPSMMFSQFKQSPLHDLAPIAQPGIHTRVVNQEGAVAARKETLAKSFARDRDDDDEDIVFIETSFTKPLRCAALVGLCPAMQYGFNNGNMNTAAVAMRADLGIPVGAGIDADNRWAFCISIFCLGALLGCSLGSMLADRLGRRMTILLNSSLYIVGGVLCAISCQVGQDFTVSTMLAGRAISGVASGATTVVVPVYLGEISPPHLRGALGTGFQLSVVVAMLLAQVLGLPQIMGNSLWPAYMMLVVLPGAALLGCQVWLLESPYWLSGRSTDEQVLAREVLGELRGEDSTSEGILSEWEMLKAEGQKALDEQFAPGSQKTSKRSGALALFADPRVRPGLVICIVCTLSQQLSGINNAFNYSTTFLTENGINPLTVTIIAVLMNLGNVLISLVAAALMDSLGRVPLLLMAATSMAASVCGLSLALTHPGQVWTSPLALVAVVCFVAGFGMGLGPIPWLLPAELIPKDKVAQGASIAATFNWSANFLVGLTFPMLANRLGGCCFLPNAVVLIIFIVYVKARVPETKAKVLDDILDELTGASAKAVKLTEKLLDSRH